MKLLKEHRNKKIKYKETKNRNYVVFTWLYVILTR